jgi:hypothetical protein
MTKQELRKSISSVALSIRQRYGLRYIDIRVDEISQIVYVGELFFTQGEDATEIIKEVDNAANLTGLSNKTCLLNHLYSAGSLYKN